ncbi:undecaprenyldiphospho-muramoylpentapeptide beta-N- acetylglucosaminyltransferase [Listeria weihenstephanensis FSL R9-0317]|nr:undecaprenyldiphospho-muramoylpentapeptide beta-N- acetylglucosaminyltransferase [Listeria weihenstephanensis FSL R9-0317]
MILEANLTADRLLDEIDSIMNSPEKLAKMQYESQQLGVPDAADKLVDAVYEIMKK